jgi:neuropeptide S receptor 1
MCIRPALTLLFAFLQVEQFTVLWILLALIVLGNSAVLVTLYLNKRRSRMNFFIMQLAGAGQCYFHM